MSDRDNSEGNGLDSSDMELETKRLMDEAMSKDTSDSSSDPSTEATETANTIDVIFQRLHGRMDDLLSTIEDELNSIEPDLATKVEDVVSSIAKQLATAGLGVFGTRATKLMKDELESSFSVDGLFSQVFEAIENSRATVSDVMEKTGKGAVRNVGQSTGDLQAKLLQMYARLSEMDKQLEATRGEVRKWRGRSNEQEERMKQREDLMATSSEEMLRMQSSIKELTDLIQERDSVISIMKGELSQAQSQAAQQIELMKALDSAEQLTSDYDAKILELSQVQGQLAQQSEQLSQKESEVTTLKDEIELLNQEKVSAESRVSTMVDELASLKGSERDFEAELAEMSNKVVELKARWDTLYRVAEDDPTFKAYFLVADKTQWFQLSHLSSALGIPTVLLKRNLQKFVDAGLLEIEDDKVRPRSLSELADDVTKSEEKMLEDARAESNGSAAESLDPKDMVMSTPEYLGPEDGDEYEQEGR